MNRVEQNKALTPSVELQRNILNDTICDVAKRFFAELAVSIALGAFCCIFVATPLAMTTIFYGIAMQTILNLVLRIYAGYHEYQNRIDPDHELPILAQWFSALSFAKSSASNAQVIVHETGHVLAVHALVEEAKTSITLFPYKGGVTKLSGIKVLTPLGKKLGERSIQPIISAAGPLFTLSISAALLGIGLANQETAPEMSRMLIVSAIIDFLSHILYALSALWYNPTYFAHDFVSIWKLAGIHPLVSAITILSIPIFIFGIYSAVHSKKSE